MSGASAALSTESYAAEAEAAEAAVAEAEAVRDMGTAVLSSECWVWV